MCCTKSHDSLFEGAIWPNFFKLNIKSPIPPILRHPQEKPLTKLKAEFSKLAIVFIDSVLDTGKFKPRAGWV